VYEAEDGGKYLIPQFMANAIHDQRNQDRCRRDGAQRKIGFTGHYK
jgi:hypothetical protein